MNIKNVYDYITGTIAPAREIPDQSGGGDYNLQLLLSNLNLVVPVASSILVIIVAIIVICVLRGKNSQNKGLLLFRYYRPAGGRERPHKRAVPLATRMGQS